MLRGNIDQITSDRVSGWVYSDAARLTGQKVLAFAGDRCVGAGEIGLMRPDLRDAGLGDGRFGFEIPVHIPDVKNLNAIHVRLDCSDFSLFDGEFHRQQHVASQRDQQLYSPEELARVEWMNRQGWLTNEQYLGLKAINTLGVYQRTFSKAELAQEPLAQRAAKVYSDIVSTVFRQDLPVEQLEVESAATYLPEVSGASKHVEILGFFGAAFALEIHEGAHADPALRDSPGLRCANAAHQVILVHARCLGDLALEGLEAVQMIRARR